MITLIFHFRYRDHSDFFKHTLGQGLEFNKCYLFFVTIILIFILIPRIPIMKDYIYISKYFRVSFYHLFRHQFLTRIP